MAEWTTNTPVVMSITSLDPSGCGGISAAIETLASLGCHCTPIVTQLLARDTAGVKDKQITDSSILIEQIRAVLEDIPVALFHISELASVSNVEAMHTILNDYPNVPVVLHARWGDQDSENSLSKAIATLLFPQANITILSRSDALALAAGADTLSACAQELMEYGCQNLFISGINEADNQITNSWYSRYNTNQNYQWPAQNQAIHGAGATLAAAMSAYLAHQFSMAESIQQAQQFTACALQKARRIGMGELLPDRLHWCRK